jgi:superfamily II DNA or RNA helicase
MSQTPKTYLGKRGYILRKKFFPKNVIEDIKSELTVKPNSPAEFGGTPEEPFPIYLENENKLYVPKFYGLKRFGQPDVNQVPQGTDITIPFSLSLKPEQQLAVDAVMQSYHEKGGGILSLPCGFGKTILALYFISQIRKKTLVIVHKEFLMNQWIERIRFALPNAKVGIIQGDKCQIEGNDIVLGMLQTLSMKEFNLDAFDEIGHVIIDECHCIPSRVFSRALLKINCNYMLGLSATPNRKDGLTKVLKFYIGDIAYMVRSAEKNVVKVERYCFESDYEEYNRDILNFRGQVQMPTMINNICNYKRRTVCFMQRVIELLNEHRERQILILSDRREHLGEMYAIANEMGMDSVGYYIGGMKEDKLKKSEGCRLLLGTYPMASTGLDIPSLNGIVLASPRSDIIQSIGRIDRKVHENIQPIILDCVDTFSLFESQSRKRLAVFKKKGYEVKDIHIQIDTPQYPILSTKEYKFHLQKKKKDDEDDENEKEDSEEEDKTQTCITSFFTDDANPYEVKKKESSNKQLSMIGKRPPLSKKAPLQRNEHDIAKELLANNSLFS